MRREMEDQRETALTRLSMIIRTNYIDDFAITLAYGFFEGLPSAVKLAGEADLYAIDFCAIMRYGNDYEEMWLMEQNLRKEQEAHDNSL